MPVTRTATRALRKSKRKEARNKDTRAEIKDIVRLSKKINEGKVKEDVREFLKKAYKVVDKAAKKNILHKNKAARIKSKITKKVTLGKENLVTKEAASKSDPKGKKSKTKKSALPKK